MVAGIMWKRVESSGLKLRSRSGVGRTECTPRHICPFGKLPCPQPSLFSQLLLHAIASGCKDMASSKPSIQSLYESYKQSTNYPLSWLWLQREPKPPESHTSFRTTSEIITAANEVCRRKVPVPASVLSTLASAIKQRKLAFESFRAIPGSSNTANASHKAFIQRYATEHIT